MATILVRTTAELQTALETAYTDPNRIIEVAGGDYSWKGYALAHLGPPLKDKPVRGLTLRGVGASPLDVHIHGDSMDNGVGRPSGYALIASDCHDLTLENLTLANAKAHLVALKGENGAAGFTARRCAFLDAGEQFIKGTANKEIGLGVRDVTIEDCHFEYRLRDYVDRNVTQGGGAILERIDDRTVRLKLSPGYLDRTSYPPNYWVGAEVTFAGIRDVSGRVVSSEPWELQPSHQVLGVDVDVPPTAERILLKLDGPDFVIAGAWGPMGGYTGAVDLHMATGTRIRRSSFRRIGTNLRSDYGHAVPAVYCWGGSKDSIVEDCDFLDCEGAVSLGLGNKTSVVETQHRNGTVRRVRFYRHAEVRGDRAIGWDTSPDNLTHDAVVVLNGTYRHAVEYRFPQTTNSVLVHLKTDAPVPVVCRPEDTTPTPVTCGIEPVTDPDYVLEDIEDTMARWEV